MSEMPILVAIRYPLKEQSIRTLQRAIELAEDQGNANLSILHINALHHNEHVTKQALANAVEREFGSLANATYHVRDAFLLEEAILYESIQQKAKYVVIEEDTRGKWRQILTHRLQIDVDVEAFLREQLNAHLIVV